MVHATHTAAVLPVIYYIYLQLLYGDDDDVSRQNTAFVLHSNYMCLSSPIMMTVGLDKMLVDEIGDVTITNDGR